MGKGKVGEETRIKRGDPQGMSHDVPFLFLPGYLAATSSKHAERRYKISERGGWNEQNIACLNPESVDEAERLSSIFCGFIPTRSEA